MSKTQKVLVEYSGPVKWVITESLVEAAGQPTRKRLMVEGKCGHAGIPTANGRTYGVKIMEREIKRLKPRIAAGSLLGALDHPPDGKSKLADAAHIVRDLWMEDDGSIHGKFEVVTGCDNGRNLAAFLDSGAQIGMSSRGLGSTKTTTEGETVGDDFKLVTFDFVSDPAVSDAYPTLVTEDNDGPEPTAEDLLARFPKQTSLIKESAYAVAQAIIEESFKDKTEDIVRAAAKETLEQEADRVRSEVVSDVRSQMSEEFGLKLIGQLQELRKEIEEDTRLRISSDPEEASAKVKLAKIAEWISPFRPPVNTQVMISEFENRAIEAIRERDEMGIKAKQISETARGLAHQLYIERVLVGREDADIVRDFIGDVSDIASTGELKSIVAHAVEKADSISEQTTLKTKAQVDAAERRMKAVQKEFDEYRQTVEARNEDIDDQVATLTKRITEREEELSAALEEEKSRAANAEDSLNEARELVESLESLNYASERGMGSARGRTLVEETKRRGLRTKESINSLAERLERRAEEPGGVGERIRRSLGRGRESVVLQESVDERRAGNDDSELLEDFGELGIDMGEIRKAINKTKINR